MQDESRPPLDARGLRIGVALSRYHAEVTDALCAGAVATFTEAGGRRDDLVIARAPGTFELPVISRALADDPDIAGVVALGCVIRGETTHDQVLAEAVAHGLTQISLDTGKPVAFGVLTCQTRHQARERAGGEQGNKGAEAMSAVIATIQTIRGLRKGAPSR